MSERWAKRMTGDQVLVVEVRELATPKPMSSSDPAWGAGAAELVYPNGASYVYSSATKIRSILDRRGFRPTESLGYVPGSIDDEPPPQRAI